MFEMFSMMTGLMKNAHLIPERAKELKQRLRESRVEATSERGLVQVVVSGELQVVSLTISPDATLPVSQIEQLVTSTVNQALAEARAKAAQEMATFADGLGVPGLSQVMSKLGLGGV